MSESDNNDPTSNMESTISTLLNNIKQWSPIKGMGHHYHFPLVIARAGSPLTIGNQEIPTILQARYVFLKSYSESFESTWNTPTRAFGRLNPDYRYLQTNRRISMSFTLPARNVADSKENLKFCSNMSRVVYGNYVVREEPTAYALLRYQYTGVELNTKLWFGNLIQKEFVVFTNFSFKPNFDAGVFEYSSTLVPGTRLMGVGEYQEQLYNAKSGELDEKSYVYHSDMGIVYPKQVDVECSVIVLHQDPLGFGGIRRSPNSIKWAINHDMHWPHDVPETDIPSYMQSTPMPIRHHEGEAQAQTIHDPTAPNPDESDDSFETFDPGTPTTEAEDGETYGIIESDAGETYYVDDEGNLLTELPE
mgnify:FL=1